MRNIAVRPPCALEVRSGKQSLAEQRDQDVSLLETRPGLSRPVRASLILMLLGVLIGVFWREVFGVVTVVIARLFYAAS
jgi:hypothetical protein